MYSLIKNKINFSKKMLLFTTLILAMTLIATACGNEKETVDSSKPIVYTSFYPIYDLTKKIAGDKLNVISFMPEDKEAHNWEPSAKEMKEVSDADLMIINGARMEPWEEKVKSSVPNLKISDLSKSVELIKVDGAASTGDYGFLGRFKFNKEKYMLDFGHTHEEVLKMGFYKSNGKETDEELREIGKEIMSKEGKNIEQKETFKVEEKEKYSLVMAHERGEIYFEVPEEGDWVVFTDRVSGDALSYYFVDKDDNTLEPVEQKINDNPGLVSYDPHSWLSLVNGGKYLDEIAMVLSELSPENKEYFSKNSEQYKEELNKIHNEYVEKFKEVKKKDFVVPHQAYAYIGRDYGLVQHPLQGITSMEDPTLKTIQEAIDFCREKGIDTVFYEYGGSKKGAESIANEIKGKIEPLSTMEFVAEEQKKNNLDYIELMKMNLENIYQSLK